MAVQAKMMMPAPAEPMAPPPPPPPSGGFFPSLARGAIQTQSLIADIIPAMVGRAVGADEYAEQQFKEFAEKQKLIEEKYAAAVPSYKDIKGVGDLVTYVTESVGELVPSIIPSIFTGGAAGILGRVAVITAKEAAEVAARKAITQGMTAEAIEAAARDAGIKAAQRMALKYESAGALVGSAAQNIPDVYQNIREETGKESLGASLLFGGFNSLLDAALPIATLAKFKKAGIPGEELVGEWYKRFGKGAAKGFATEGATEAAQEMSSAAAEKFVDENKDFFTEKNLERFLNAGLKGGLGGGVVSGSTDVMLGKRPPTQDELVKELRPGETLEQGINRVYGELTANRMFLDELRQQHAEEGKTKLNDDALSAMGYKQDDPLYPALVNKDLNNPVEAEEVVSLLGSALEDPKAKTEQKTLYADSLEMINGYLSTTGEINVGEAVTPPSGAGAGVAGVPSLRTAPEGLGEAEPTGMVRPPEIAGQLVGREEPAPAPVAPPIATTPEVAAPEVAAPVAPPVPEAIAPVAPVAPQVAVAPSEVPSIRAPEVVTPVATAEAPVEAPQAPIEAPVQAQVEAPVEPAVPTTAELVKQQEERVGQITNKFQSLLQQQANRYGLKNVAVNVVDDLKNANGQYSKGLIKMAIDATDPVRDLRHESIHALKELGFFSDAQWNTLVRMANQKWVDQHLRGVDVNGNPLAEGQQSRHDAYVELYGKQGMSEAQIQELLVEEAIADAFGGFAATKPPPGFLNAILNRMRNFFRAIKETVGIASPETAERIFGKIEAGKLAQPTVTAQGEKVGQVQLGESAVRPSIRGAEAPGAGEERARGRGEPGRIEVGKVSPPERAAQEELKPLPGAPKVAGFYGPDPQLVAVATQYAKDNGIKLKRQAEFVKVDPERASRIAQAYEEMPHAPQDPAVKEAYKNLIKQTTKQYEALVNAGYKFWFMDMSREDNQKYASSPWNAMRDIRANKEMGVFPTSEGFGTSEAFDPSTNPLLEDTGFKWPFGSPNGPLKPVLANDLFRAVHDAFGHGLEGAGFRADGEENAWQAHARLFTGSALGALTSETRGQNSWLNFGPHGEKNRTAKVEDTVFADQKTGLMPEWTWQEGKAADESKGVVLGTRQPSATSFTGTHYGNARVDKLSGSKYGSGIRGAESRRLQDTEDERIKRRSYFYIPKTDGTMPLPESGLGQYVYTQQFDNILGPGPEMSRLFREAGGNPNEFESAVVDAGYDGYAVPNMGMMVILNHDVPVNYEGTRAEKAAKKAELEKPSLRGPQTKEFKRWFGDSKVVDADGNPLVMYHGAKEDIESGVFRMEKGMLGTGAYFTSNPKEADFYTSNATWRTDPNIVPVYISIKNPYFAKDKWDKGALKAKENGHDGVILMDPNGKIDWAIPFSATQIKSAIGNIGTYDVTNPDIRFSIRAPKTDEFERFFEGSKAKNEQGDPLLYYHGSVRDKRMLRPKVAGAIFFSPDPSFAEGYIQYKLKELAERPAQYLSGPEIRDAVRQLRQYVYDTYGRQSKTAKDLLSEITEVEDQGKRTGIYKFRGELGDIWRGDEANFGLLERKMQTGRNLTPVFINVKNPFDYEDKKQVARVINKLTTSDLAGDKMQELGLFKRGQTFEDQEKIIKDYYRDKIASGDWETIETPEVQEAIRALKHDGFYAAEQHTEGATKNLAVYNSDQAKSAIGNVGAYGQREVTEEEAKGAGVTKEEAAQAQKAGDIRFSLRAFSPDQLPKNNKPYTLPQGTILYHGAYKSVADAIDSVGYLMSRPQIKAHGGTTNEGGLVWFGGEDTARAYANSKADPFSVEADRKAGIVREPGKVFEAVTDKPYKLIDRNQVLNKAQAEKLNDVLGLPDYKRLNAGASVNTAAYRAHEYTNSNAPRYKVKSKGVEQEVSAPYPLIFEALGVDGFYDNGTIALSAKEGIKLGEPGQPMTRFSLRSQVGPAITARMLQTTTAREEKGFAERITSAFSPQSRSRFRAQFLNRYNRLGEYDKIKLERSGGMDFYADATAEGAALLSDLGAGVLASAFGVHDKVGGIPVYKRHYIVQKEIAGPNGISSFVQVGKQFDNYADAKALADKQGGVVRERGYTGVSNMDNTVKGPIAIFAPLAKYNDPDIYRLYQFWAGVKRGSKYMAVPQKSGGFKIEEKLFTPQDIALAKQLEQKFPEFKNVQKEWIKYNDGLVKFMMDTGVISKKQAEIFTKHGDYMPFYRQANDDENAIGPRIFQSIGNVKAPQKLKHGEDPLGDFMENMVQNSQAAIQAGIKNIAARRAADVGMDVGTVAKLPEASSDPNAFYVMENGEKVYYETSDILFTEAIKSLGLPNVPFIGLLSAPASVLRNLVTKDPGFMLANMMRDSLSAWATSGVKMTPIAATLVNFGGALANKSPEIKALHSAGILGGYDYSQNVVNSAKQLEKELRKQAGAMTTAEKALRPATYLWEALEKGTQASDAATRIEIYKKTLQETGNEAEALFRSLEVMNFNRKGSNPIVRVATAAIPFLNARMQGLDVLYRAGFGANATKNAKEIQKAFFVRGMTMAALSSMYWMLTHDDDDYKKQEQEVRDNNWILPGLGIKIPIPFEVGVLFKVIPERILGVTFGQDTAKDFTQSMIRQLSSTLAFNPIPQAALPVVEYMTNYSFFTGRPIVGQGMEGVAPAYQVGPGTSRLAQGIGEVTKGLPSYLQLSPLKVDQLINGYTGTMGMYMVDLMDAIYDTHSDSPKPSKRFEQLPVFKRFLVDPESRGQVSSYYDLKHSVDEATRTENLLQRTMNFEEYGKYMKDNVKMLAVKDYILDLNKTMTEFNQMKVMIRSSNMSADAKRDALLNIGRAENQLAANIQMLKKRMD